MAIKETDAIVVTKRSTSPNRTSWALTIHFHALGYTQLGLEQIWQAAEDTFAERCVEYLLVKTATLLERMHL